MTSTTRIRLVRAFTLIEVLIGVLVLALGLLGLGAIIPVVIREQRHSVNITLGNEAAQAAKKYLLGRPDLNPAADFNYVAGIPPERAAIGWDVWLMGANPSLPPTWSPTTGVNAYLWERWRTTGSQQEIALSPTSVAAWGVNPGDFGWHTTAIPEVHVTISLADRLWPSESMQGEAYLRPGLDPHRPQFVWDFIGRRVQTKPGEPRQLQIAIFVRQLDLNIRIPRGNHTGNPVTPITLRDVVLNRNLPFATDARVPVCSDSAGSALEYLPTNAGILPNNTLHYSEPVFIGAQFDPADPSRIEFLDAPGGTPLSRNANAWKLVSQSGQKIVDNLGNVYTVRGIADELEPGDLGASTEVIVDPPVPAWVPNPNGAGYDPNGPGVLRQVVFTPQIPAAVEVFTITRTVP